MSQILKPEPLTYERFLPFGDVIEARTDKAFGINQGYTDRFHHLASIQLDDEGSGIISLFRGRSRDYPLPITMLERHPLGSQAFMPLDNTPFLVVVAPPADTPDPQHIRAFISNGYQGVNYHRGVWHHPLLTGAPEQDFLVVDRSGAGNNCDEYYFLPEQIPLLVT